MGKNPTLQRDCAIKFSMACIGRIACWGKMQIGMGGGGGILSCDNSFKKMLLESDAWTDIS